MWQKVRCVMKLQIPEYPAAQQGKPRRKDYTYKRLAHAISSSCFAQAGWYHAKVTQKREGADSAKCLRDLVDIHLPDAEKMRKVQDNLNTQQEGSIFA